MHYQKIWVAGANGRVGRQIVKLLERTDAEVLCTDIDSVDITSAAQVQEFAQMNHPHAIINCAGFTDVNACENNLEEAFKVNALGARNLSVAARKANAKIVQLSTDDVFSGDIATPYHEFDTPAPTSIYGKSKLAGENFVKELNNKHIIIRSSWIFGTGDSYLTSVLERIKAGQDIKAAKDQIGTPTCAKTLAIKIIEIMESGQYGLYHITGTGSCSRYEYAKEIVKLMGSNVTVTPVSASEDVLTSMHPDYSVLDNLMLRMCGFTLLPSWERMLSDYLASLTQVHKDS